MFNVERRTLLRAGILTTLTAPIIDGLPLVPARAAGENLLVNGDFELASDDDPNQPANWVTSTPQYVSRDATAGRSGSSSLHIQAPSGQGAPWAFQQLEVVEGGIYEISAWTKQPSSVTAMIKFEFYTSPITTADTWVGDESISHPGSTNTDWQQVTGQVTVPETAKVAKVYLRYYSPCDANWDDASLVFVKMAEPVQLEMFTDQGVHYPDVTTGKVTVGVTPADGVLAGKTVRLAIGQVGQGPVITRSEAAAESMVFEFATGDLAMRTPYEVVVELLDGAGTPLYALSSMIIRWERPTTLNEAEEILVDGEPFFPVIMYHVGAADYPLMPTIGVNTVQLSGSTVESTLQLLDAAQDAGLKGLVVLYKGMRIKENADWYRELIPAVKDHPAVLAWALMDEPDGNNKMDEIFDGYRLARSLDDEHPVYMVSCFPTDYRGVEHATDVLATDIYPLDNKPIGTVGSDIDIAMSVTPSKPVWQILQAFYLPNYGWTYLPTITDVRNMAHQSINHGATGLGYYSMTDPGWALVDSPLWPGLVAAEPELARLGELATDPSARQLSRVTTDTTEYAIYQQRRGYVVSVLNLTKEPQQVTVPLPRQLARRTATTRFGGDEVIVLQGRDPSLTVDLERHGCRLIEIP
ncbi:carbohydrate binding domain-containing protein [Microlunatus sp. Y2014]|uniref:carbohydrate binding domain-containing protein n=1 Tax=Microlunatus sp. Y2014 TaxID=3418488 RepID=UPI003DA6E351